MPQKAAIKTGFFRNMISSFRPSFYRNAAQIPLTNAFVHIAILSGMLAATISLIIYYHYTSAIFPAYTEFYTKGMPDSLFIEKGKIEYDGSNPYTYSAEILDRRLSIIIDTATDTESIPDSFDEVLLVTKNKIFLGNAGKSVEIPLPDNRISARQYLIDIHKANPASFLIQGVQVFTTFFAGAAIVAGIFAAALYVSISRKIAGSAFSHQMTIICFSMTPLFTAALAILGVSQPALQIGIVILSFLYFIMLSVMGTVEYARNGAAENKEGMLS